MIVRTPLSWHAPGFLERRKKGKEKGNKRERQKGSKKGLGLRLTHIEVVFNFLEALLHLPVPLHLNFHPAYHAARRATSIHPK
jgi:hypothetical protein